MPESGVERRRWLRSVMPTDEGEELELGTSLTVRILDLSLTGALLQSSSALLVGQRAVLRTVLGGYAFAVEAEVRHVLGPEALGNRPPQVRMGVAFVGLDGANRTVLERVLPA